MGRGRRRYAGAHRQSLARAVRFGRRDHRPGWRRGHPLPARLRPAHRRARGMAGTHRHEHRGGAAACLRRAARRHVHQAALITHPRDPEPTMAGATHATLNDLPESARGQLIDLLNQRLASFDVRNRLAIAEPDDLADTDVIDICTEILRGVDKWLWFVEAQADGATATARAR